MPNSVTRQVRLLWVVHFHQPLGNFPEVFDAYTGRVCAPFLAALESIPRSAAPSTSPASCSNT